MQHRFSRALLACFVSFAFACGDSGESPTSSTGEGPTTGSGTTSTGDATSTTGSGTTTTTTTSSGTGGMGGGGFGPTAGVPGSEMVNAGDVMTSPNYKLHVTIGQSSPAQSQHGSPNHTLRGGVVGATQ